MLSIPLNLEGLSSECWERNGSDCLSQRGKPRLREGNGLLGAQGRDTLRPGLDAPSPPLCPAQAERGPWLHSKPVCGGWPGGGGRVSTPPVSPPWEEAQHRPSGARAALGKTRHQVRWADPRTAWASAREEVSRIQNRSRLGEVKVGTGDTRLEEGLGLRA